MLKNKKKFYREKFKKFLIEVVQLLNSNELASRGQVDIFPDDYLLGVYFLCYRGIKGNYSKMKLNIKFFK